VIAMSETPAGVSETFALWVVPALRSSFIEHADALVRLAGLLTRDPDAAEEIVQEAFVRLHRALPRLRDTDALLPYLRTTVVNLSRSRGRRLAVAARHQHEAPPAVEGADAAALRRLESKLVIEAIAGLPTRQRECIVLRFYEEMSEAETAAVLGVSKNSVKKHLQRAMASLASRLDEGR
jgi:RNA polymerase sigma-70 factor (sigma-E family)